MQTIDFIVKEAQKLNDKGTFFPIWTTCLGYEALVISLSNYSIKRTPILSENHSLNILLEPAFVQNFNKYFDLKMIKDLQEKPYSFFNHKFAFLPN